jgi:stringent starvation protein B
MVDSELSPYVLVNARVDAVSVPAEFVIDGMIVLNVAPHAVRDLSFDDGAVVCQCRFGGNPFAVYLPISSIEAIYAKETGEGMAFEAEHFPEPPSGGDDDRPGGHLKVVK